MQKYNCLLSKISGKYHIYKGKQETENDWKTRLVYSICGMMAYASLWDDSEGPVSIVHLKKKIRSMLANYRTMYPEISGSLPCVSEELEAEIADQFINAGVVYHCPNRIVPSMKREESFGNILFQRGIALDSISRASGLGYYSKPGGEANLDRIKAMFGLEQEDLQTLWNAVTSDASWEPAQLPENNIEYLRLYPPFTRGYWEDRTNPVDAVSILRTGMSGSQLYYLYRNAGTAIEVCPLPQWKVESYNYRTLACACLSAKGTLPPIEYYADGELVHIRLKYLLPPRELNFLKLYSWPESCTSLPCDFKRKLSTEVFLAIKDILADEGYEFKKEMI